MTVVVQEVWQLLVGLKGQNHKNSGKCKELSWDDNKRELFFKIKEGLIKKTINIEKGKLACER